MQFVPATHTFRRAPSLLDKVSSAISIVGGYAVIIVYLLGWLREDLLAQGYQANWLWLIAPALISIAPRAYRSLLEAETYREPPICWSVPACPKG